MSLVGPKNKKKRGVALGIMGERKAVNYVRKIVWGQDTLGFRGHVKDLDFILKEYKTSRCLKKRSDASSLGSLTDWRRPWLA